MALADLLDDTRADWGALPADGTIYTEALTNKSFFLTHWDGNAPLLLEGKTHDACLARVRAVQRYHLSKWSDIGYNTLVCPHGRLIEARGILAVGAQCPGYNRYGIGSQLMVGAGDTYSPVMLARQRRFYEELGEERSRALAKLSHSDGTATTCAGPWLNKWVDLGMPAEWQEPTPTAPVPVPVPIPKPIRKVITADGMWGRETTTQTQLHFGTTPDGVISTPYSAMVAAVQGYLSRGSWECRHGDPIEVDGAGIQPNMLGRWPATGSTHTIETLQRWLGIPMDGYFSSPSATVKAWQRWLNARVK